jgi:hypothetical protein
MVDREEIIEIKDQKLGNKAGSKEQREPYGKAKLVLLLVFSFVIFPILCFATLPMIFIVGSYIGMAGEWFYNWLIATFR